MKKLFKAHALGNDFLLAIVEDINLIDKNFVLTWNHRFFGIGCNQFLVLDSQNNVQIWNEDGSLANLCGNGLRCLAKLVGKKNIEFFINSGSVLLENLENGNVSLAITKKVKIEQKLDHYFVDIGNLHNIYFVDNNTQVNLLSYKNDTHNYSFLSLKKNEWHIRTMESNSEKETLACGSASLAAAHVLKQRGETNLTLHYSLGSITHQVNNKRITQIGPATLVAEITLLK